MRVALFVTCLGDTLFPGAAQATVAVLERLGHRVDFPDDQTCCGQMHANSGYAADATRLLRRWIRAFSEHDTIVCPSASCAGMVRHRYPRLAERTGDSSLVREVHELTSRVYELSELLVTHWGIEDVGARFAHRVTYHPTCHSLRELRIGDAPTRLLRAVEGLELLPLPDADTCCGFGGTFAVKSPDVSTAMLIDKLRAIADTGAEVCTAVDSSCLMHISGGSQRQQSGVRFMHLAEVLACQN